MSGEFIQQKAIYGLGAQNSAIEKYKKLSAGERGAAEHTGRDPYRSKKSAGNHISSYKSPNRFRFISWLFKLHLVFFNIS